FAGRVGGIDANIASLAGAVIVDRDVTAVFTGIDEVGVGRVGDSEAGFAAADGVPIAEGNACGGKGVTRSGGGPLILHGSHHPVRHAIVDADVIELADRQRGHKPGFAGVGRNVHAAVVAVDHTERIRRIDPQVVVIGVMYA